MRLLTRDPHLRFHMKLFDMLFNFNIKLIIGLTHCIMYPIIRIIAKRRRYCPPIKNNVLFCTATLLSRRIRKKEITSEEVISAYITRCKEVNPVLNAIAEDRFEAAIQEARAVDDFLKSTTKREEELEREMPLLGLPVTVKQSIAVKGMCYSVGVYVEKGRKATEDADVVKNIRTAGGIPILVSNTPELCMFWETDNQITGRTLNPYNTQRTPGGSSGGEAALLGSGASLLSLSSDIGGSARLPAMFCGVFGHKPSPHWVSSVGHRPDSAEELWDSVFSISPMTRYAVDLPLLLKVMSQSKEYLKNLDQEVDLRHVKFYYVENADSGPLSTTVDRELKQTIDNLIEHLQKTYGSSVQKVNLQDLRYGIKMALFSLSKLNKVETILNLGDVTKPWKKMFITVLRRFCCVSYHTWPPILYAIGKKVTQALPKKYIQIMIEKHDLLRKELKEMLGNDGVLIYPSFCSVTGYHREMYYKFLNSYHLMLFNTLNLPATQCNMGLNDNGLPVGLQVVANNDCDHLCFAVAREVERRFGGWQEPPSDTRAT